jgi:hypothetical protein
MRAVARVAVAAGLVVGVVVLLALVKAGSEDNRVSEADGRLELVQQYDSAFVTQWVQGCIGSGESERFCQCAIDVYTSRLRPDEFETASAVAQGGGQLSELPENVRAAVQAVERDCR